MKILPEISHMTGSSW